MATDIPSNQAAFDLDEVAAAVSGTVRGARVRVVGVSTDSRAVPAGGLFVALAGERFDAHAFLSDVAARGAAAALVSDASRAPAELPVVVVPDTLVALGELGRLHRRRVGGTVIGITGSAGKTTTKELVRAALSPAGAVHATVGNLNNRVGVPMTLLARTTEPFSVIEMGTSERGEIATLTSIVEPDVALITSIGLSHALGIGTEEDVAVEKGALLRGLRDGSTAVVLLDDERIARHVRSSTRVVTFGRHAEADVRVDDVRVGVDGVRAALVIGGETRPLFVPIPSEIVAVNAAGAIAVARALGVDLDAAVAALAGTDGAPGRMKLLRLPTGAVVVDDTYNANPRSMATSLASAAKLSASTGGRLLCVLGDMKELGEHAASAHADVGRSVAALRAARFVAVGEAMRAAASEAAKLGVDVAQVVGSADAAAELRLEPGDVVLVKGSRSMRMERVVEALTAGGLAP